MNNTLVLSRSTPYNMPLNGATLTSTTTSTGNAVELGQIYKSFQLTLTSAGTATVVVEGSMDNAKWTTPLQTLTFGAAGTQGANDTSCYRYYRFRVTAITGGTLGQGYCGA